MIWEQTKALHGGDKVAAAIYIARGLSTQDPSDPFKMPYTPENAFLAVVDLASLHDDTFTTDEENAIKLALADGRSAKEIAADWEKGNVPDDPEDEVDA